MAGDCHGDGRYRQRQPRHEPADPAEASAHEVIREHHAGDPHQRLWDEQAERVITEHARGQRLHPQGERRLVDRHHAAGVKRGKQEVVPAGAHRAHRCGVVGVRPAVAPQSPQVERSRERHQRGQLGAQHAQGREPRLPPPRRDGGTGGERHRGRGNRCARACLSIRAHRGSIATACRSGVRASSKFRKRRAQSISRLPRRHTASRHISRANASSTPVWPRSAAPMCPSEQSRTSCTQ